MKRCKSAHLEAILLACFASFASLPSFAQGLRETASSPAPICQARGAEFQPRVDLTAPRLAVEGKQRQRNIVVLNGRGHNYQNTRTTPRTSHLSEPSGSRR